MQGPTVSVLVRTLNERRWIEPLLRSLGEQTLAPLEVVVVDSGSHDGTQDIARRHTDKLLEIDSDSFSFGYALNQGVAACRGDLIAIVSAHTLPMHTRWLAALRAPFGADPASSGLAVTYGMQRGGQDSNYAECRDFISRFPTRSRRQPCGDWYCNNANSLIRRDLWNAHPFDETLPGYEDIAWARYWSEKGLAVEYVAEGGIYHVHDESSAQIYNRYRREAIALGMMGVDGASAARQVLAEGGLALRNILGCLARLRWRQARESVSFRWWKLRGSLDGARVGHALQTVPGPSDASDYHALEIRGVNEAEIVSKPIPEVKPNDVLIRVAYVGICQTDLEVLHQSLGYYTQGKARLPIVPGHEYSGVVFRVGANVRTLAVGDRVVGECILSCGSCPHCLANRLTACNHRREVGVINYDGGCADYVLLPARFVHRLPDGFPLLTACTVEPLAVVLKGFQRVGLRHSREVGRRRILVVGAGAIGNLCCQAARHWGHHVEVVDRIAERREHLGGVCEETHEQLPDLTHFDYIAEATGVVELAEVVLKTSTAGCHLLFLGFPYGPLHWNLENLVANDLRAVGSVGSDYATFEAAIEMLPHLTFDLFNKHVLDFWDWETAYEMQRSKEHLKIKLRMSAAESPFQNATGAGA
jgi:threonine dehydrogenase-like Zn-dependent dehydrogenase/glycosyltransferase involved in cell wall biosynthesis